MPPYAAQEPTASVKRLRADNSRTQSIIGLPVPPIMWKRPVPIGPIIIDPSRQRISSWVSPLMMLSSMAITSSPLSSLRDGCQSRLMPAVSNRVSRSGDSALSSDIEQPPQPPDCNQRRLSIAHLLRWQGQNRQCSAFRMIGDFKFTTMLRNYTVTDG